LAAAKQKQKKGSFLQKLELISNSSMSGMSPGGRSNSIQDYTPSQISSSHPFRLRVKRAVKNEKFQSMLGVKNLAAKLKDIIK